MDISTLEEAIKDPQVIGAIAAAIVTVAIGIFWNGIVKLWKSLLKAFKRKKPVKIQFKENGDIDSNGIPSHKLEYIEKKDETLIILTTTDKGTVIEIMKMIKKQKL